jgi:uncharacterized membrane protein
MMNSAILFVVVFLLILLLWGIKQPLAWVALSILAIGCGIGCAGFGFTQGVLSNHRIQTLEHHQIEEIGAFIGIGLGSTIAGLVLLIVGLWRWRKSAVSGPQIQAA